MRVGLIGCGFIGLKHVEAIARMPDAQLVALSDTMPDRMRAAWQSFMANGEYKTLPAPGFYTSYEALLADREVELVAVTTPSGSHGEICRAALAAGRHVIVEKPMTLDLAEARTLVDIASRRHLKLAVCHQKRFMPHLRAARDMMQSGHLGRLVLGSVSLICNRSDEYYRSAAWRGTWKMDGGAVLNQGIHDVDLLCWLIGGVRSVTGQASRLLRPIEAEDTAVISMTMESGALCRVEVTTCSTPAFFSEELTLVGSEATLRLSGKNLENIEAWGVDPPAFGKVDTYQALYQDMRNAIVDDRDPLVNGRDALRTLETIFAFYTSVRTGQETWLPLSDFSTESMEGLFAPHGRTE